MANIRTVYPTLIIIFLSQCDVVFKFINMVLVCFNPVKLFREGV